MKKDRNCGGNYPVYPMPYGNAQMAMPMPTYGGMPMPLAGPMPMQYGNMGGSSSNTSNLENQITNLNNQINSLEQRVNSLETLVNKGLYSSNYNTSNYQMM